MTTLKFGVTVPLPPGAIVTAALGVNAAGFFAQADVGKAVKMAANDNYVLCADGDPIEGVVDNIVPGLVNNGFSHGGVLKHIAGLTRLEVIINTATAVVFGDYVVASAQAAVGTANASGTTKNGGTSPLPLVKKGAGTEKFAWRVISLLGGNGAQNTVVLVEAVATTL